MRNIDEDIGVYEKPQGRQSRISGIHGAASMRDYIRKSRQGEPVDSGEMLKLIYQIIRHLDEKYLQALKAFIESEIEHREQEDE